MMIYLYALEAPGGEIRYIGKTARPTARFREHLRKAGRDRTYCARWIKSLSLPPTMRVLAVAPESVAEELEVLMIENFKKDGTRLTNLTLGGEGTCGLKFSAQHRARISAAMRGRKASYKRHISPEASANLSRLRKGRKLSEEHKRKLSAALLGNQRAKGKKMSAEAKARITAAATGRKLSPEAREKIRTAKTAWHAARRCADTL